MPEKIKLLIADDEVEFLDSIAKRLELREFAVTKAVNGEEAVTAAEKEKFDLALLDLKMPGLDGKQVLEILKREHKYLEVIILTGHGSLESAVECTKLGAYSYLPKPYEMEKLIESLRDAYTARMQKKFAHDEQRMNKILGMAPGSSALSILRTLREMDDEEK
jgi:two-component system NtrC family response regulator